MGSQEPSPRSDLRVVLVGQEGVGKSSAGNTILGKKEFGCRPVNLTSRPLTLSSEKKDGNAEGRRVSVVDTPGLCSTCLSEGEVEIELLRAVELSSPGPHVFLLVLQLDTFNEQEQKLLETLKEVLGPNVTKHIMVLFTYGDQQRDTNMEQFIRERQSLQNLLQNCSGQYHVFNNKQMGDVHQVQQLLGKIDAISEGGKSYYKKEEQGDIIRIMLVGKTGIGKSSSGNTILGERKFEVGLSTSSVTAESKKAYGEFEGQRVAVTDTPGLFDETRPQEQIRKEIRKAICYAAPGPHAILVVIQLGRFAKEDEETVKIFQKIFGEEAEKYTIILFTHGDALKDSDTTVDTLISQSTVLYNLNMKCHGKYHVFTNRNNDRSQVQELMEKINAMLQRNGGGYYTNEKFVEAEVAIVEKYKQLLQAYPNISNEEARRLAEEDNSFISGLKVIGIYAATGAAVGGAGGIAAGGVGAPVGAAIGAVGGAAVGVGVATVKKTRCTMQ